MRSLLIGIASILCLAAHAGRALSAPPQRPNFLVIIADDLGYSDLGCYGGEIATPHLDALAAGGLRYTQFYNTARCWPTRAALLTGYYPQQVRRDAMPGADPTEFGGRGVRPAWAQLLSQHLQAAGYRTYHSGKWHIDGQPLQCGFDRSDMISRGPGFFVGLDRRKTDPGGREDDSRFYLTTATAEHAIECLRQHAAEYSDRPFFQYLAFHAPHFPLHALPEDIARYRDRYLAGWDELRAQRHARQQELGFGSTALSEREPEVGPPYDFPDQIEQLGKGEVNRPLAWDDLSDEQQRFQATKMAIHAAMIDRMDREIGRVLEQLQAMNAFQDTLICFLSDNGASAEIMVRGDGHDPTAPLGSAATYLCLGPGFSTAANTPFRRHKTWVHEGGISTPFIVHWPRGIAARSEMRTAIAHVIDVAPTLMQLAGIDPVAVASGPPLPGRSLQPTFSDPQAVVHDVLWYYHEGNRALRQGDWKIVHTLATRPFPWASSDAAAAEAELMPDWQLYNIAKDRAEQHNLAERFPQRTRSMAAEWTAMGQQFLRDAARRDR